MKKLLAAILSIVMCALCLFGCTGGEQSETKAAADSDDVVINVWSSEAGAQSVWEELVDNWNSTTGDEKNIFINWATHTDGQKIDVAEQNDQLPNIFGCSGTQLQKFIEKGTVISLNELPGGEEFLKEYGQEGQEGRNMIDGKQYSVYMNVRTSGLVYNKDLFKKAGLVDENGEAKPPTTVSEVVEYAKKITALGNGVYGFAFPLKFGLNYTVTSPMSTFYDGKTAETSQAYLDLDKGTYDLSNYHEQYDWLFEMKEDGSLFPGAETLDNDTARAYFSTGIIGMIPAISWDVSVYNNQFKAECDWDVCKYPAPDGREEYQQWSQLGGGMVIGRIAAEKNPEETLEAYKFIYSLETRKAMFERGINLSAKNDVLEIYNKDAVDPRFAKFASFVDDTKRYATKESVIVEGESFGTLFQKVWMGEMTFDDALETYSESYAKDFKRTVEKGEYDIEREKRVRRYLQGEDGLDLTKK